MMTGAVNDCDSNSDCGSGEDDDNGVGGESKGGKNITIN
jgi:hypothetical protein